MFFLYMQDLVLVDIFMKNLHNLASPTKDRRPQIKAFWLGESHKPPSVPRRHSSKRPTFRSRALIPVCLDLLQWGVAVSSNPVPTSSAARIIVHGQAVSFLRPCHRSHGTCLNRSTLLVEGGLSSMVNHRKPPAFS